MSVFCQLTNEAYRQSLCMSGEKPEAVELIHAARCDTAAFQVILQSDRQYSVNVGTGLWVSDRAGLMGEHECLRVALKAPFAGTLRIEEYVNDDDGIRKADMLLNSEVRESYANLPTVVWVELEIPEDAGAGDYPVEIFVYRSCGTEDECCVAKESLTVSVADFCLPKPQDWKFYLDLWQHSSNIARKHDLPLWSEEHFRVLKNYIESLAALGQKSITVLVSEIPWGGQGCREDHAYGGNLFEYSMVPVTRKSDGSLVYDYSIMQRYIDLCTHAGLCGDIEVFGLVNIWSKEEPLCREYPESILLRYYDEQDGCMKYMRNYDDICSYIQSLEAYFIRTSQIERVRIAADEPSDVEKYRQSLALLHSLAPQFRCKTAINHAEFIGEFHEQIDDFSPYLHCVVREYEALKNYQSMYADKRFLWYTCCGSAIPNTLLRAPLLECRMIGILTSFLGFEGYLRWAYTVWPEDPRREIRYGIFDAGDNHFVYPAYNGDVMLSLRYHQLRRGIVDFELLERYRQLKGTQAMLNLLSGVIAVQDVHDLWREENRLKSGELFSQSWQDYDRLKAELLSAL